MQPVAVRWSRVPKPILLAALVVSSACSPTKSKPSPRPPPGAGVVFTYPRDQQVDVPTGAQLVLTFTDPIHADAVAKGCTGDATTEPVGAFCVVGPNGPVQAASVISGDQKNVLLFQSSTLAPGATYRVYARPELIGGTAANLPTTGPLFTFTTRTDRSAPGQAPQVVRVNGELPEAFTAGSHASPKLPFLDLSTIRLIFSEPLDPATASALGAVKLVRVDGASETEVPGTLICDGIHLTFDPDDDLVAGATYRLDLAASIHDLGGEALEPASFEFHPAAGNANGPLFEQDLAIAPASDDPVAGGKHSVYTGTPVNRVGLASQLLGVNELGILSGGLRSELADPKAFGGPIPLRIRKGQQIDMSTMKLFFDGKMDSSHETGKTHIIFLSDATGYLFRNPYRDPSTLPDDQRAPVYLDLTFDVALVTEDDVGNKLSNQNILGVRALGTAVADGDHLAIENIGSMEFVALAVSRATCNMVLHLESHPGAGGPVNGGAFRPVSSYPVPGSADFPVDGRVLVYLSAPPDPKSVAAVGGVVLTRGGGAVPARVAVDGSTLIVTPQQRLTEGQAYSLKLNGLTAFDGRPLTLSADGGPLYYADGGIALDADGGPILSTDAGPLLSTATLPFRTPAYNGSDNPTPAMLTAVYPGVPCAITGASATSTGHCAGGLDNDSAYVPFTMPANRKVVVDFSQPMDPTTLVLGTACGQGSVRIEKTDSSGRCIAPVPGTLHKEDRALSFTPAQPWEVGQSYRIVLIAGSNDTCDSGEICSRAHKPLNTDPLNGIKDGNGGGPDVIIPFEGEAATQDTYLPQWSFPFADQNANGWIDTGEVAHVENQVKVEIAGTSGIIDSVDLKDPDCDPVRPGVQNCEALYGDLPVSVEAPMDQCPVDANGVAISGNTEPCVRVRVYADLIRHTGLTMDVNTNILGISFTDQKTGMVLMRPRENGGPAYGYIVHDPAQPVPQFVIHEQIYIDAPDMVVFPGWSSLVTHDLHSKSLDIALKGPVDFKPDGRLLVALSNMADITFRVTVHPLVGGDGYIDMRIPAHEMHLSLVAPPIK